jgi:hypothetical protein
MSVSITLPNSLEEFLSAEASRQGVPLEKLLSTTIEERWSGVSQTPHLSTQETALLLEIQNAFPQEQTLEWQALRKKSDSESLTDAERERFLQINEERDLQNAQRLEAIGKLAHLRNISVRELMKQLGIRPE